MLSFALSKIEHRREKLEKMKVLKANKSIVSVSTLAQYLGVSRQTVYNWRDAGYIFRPEQSPSARKPFIPLTPKPLPGGIRKG